MAGTVTKRRLKKVANFFIFDVQSRPKDIDIQCMIAVDVGINAKIATQQPQLSKSFQIRNIHNLAEASMVDAAWAFFI